MVSVPLYQGAHVVNLQRVHESAFHEKMKHRFQFFAPECLTFNSISHEFVEAHTYVRPNYLKKFLRF